MDQRRALKDEIPYFAKDAIVAGIDKQGFMGITTLAAGPLAVDRGRQ